MTEATIPPDSIERIRAGLLNWFAENARDLPWRRTRDPYAILVSEVMLQQTQVDRVIPYYERFLTLFPSAAELASAPTADLIRLWSGLGYNRRVVNLQRAAQAVVENHGGDFPSSPDAIRSLPGVGAYTTGAISAFAFERDAVFLDTNMRRVISRWVFGVEPVPERAVLAAAAALLPPGQGWTWNQALIEFGALQCTARRPACVICPLSGDCAAFPEIQSSLALKRTAKPKRPVEKFETSTRYYRGRIVAALRELPTTETHGISLTELGPRVLNGYTDSDLPWLRGLVEGLQRDGLAAIAEDSPRYDADHDVGNQVRIRLP